MSERIKALPAMLLYLVILSPNLLMVISSTPMRSFVVNQKIFNNVKTIEALNVSFLAVEKVELVYWNNESVTGIITEEIFVNDPTCSKVKINCTTTVTKDAIRKAGNPSKTQSIVKPCAFFPGKYEWDGMVFLPAGNNGTHIVEYTQDDNFDTYYPQEWFRSWNLSGEKYLHSHLSAQEVTDWIDRKKSAADIFALIFGIAGGLLEVVGGVAVFLKCPVVAVPAIIGGLASILAAIIQYVYNVLEIQWIKNVVQTWYGDGFTWFSSIVFPFFTWIQNFFWNAPITTWWRYDFREWDQSWGAERDHFQHYCVTWEPAVHIKTMALNPNIHEPPPR
ncbi:hypothetical protein KEJ15_08510 [Candidatus Bathyarchaeota archaeon]|nr:hypothetical protein [Candidatus Bathyarchaeota archaeon]